MENIQLSLDEINFELVKIKRIKVKHKGKNVCPMVWTPDLGSHSVTSWVTSGRTIPQCRTRAKVALVALRPYPACRYVFFGPQNIFFWHFACLLTLKNHEIYHLKKSRLLNLMERSGKQVYVSTWQQSDRAKLGSPWRWGTCSPVHTILSWPTTLVCVACLIPCTEFWKH